MTVASQSALRRRRPVAQLTVRLARGRSGIGAYMFIAHRITGIVLTVYLYVHLITLGTILRGPDDFDRAMALMNRPSIRLLELALVAIVVYHTLNGIRVCTLVLVPAAGNRWLAYAVLGTSLLVALASVPLFVG